MSVEANTNGSSAPWGIHLPDEQRERIRQRNAGIADAIRAGRPHAEIAYEFGVSKATVSNVSRFNVKGLPRWRKKVPLPPLLASPARADIVQAEAELKKAQREVLVAEAIVLEARAQLLREKAYAIR